MIKPSLSLSISLNMLSIDSLDICSMIYLINSFTLLSGLRYQRGISEGPEKRLCGLLSGCSKGTSLIILFRGHLTPFKRSFIRSVKGQYINELRSVKIEVID